MPLCVYEVNRHDRAADGSPIWGLTMDHILNIRLRLTASCARITLGRPHSCPVSLSEDIHQGAPDHGMLDGHTRARCSMTDTDWAMDRWSSPLAATTSRGTRMSGTPDTHQAPTAVSGAERCDCQPSSPIWSMQTVTGMVAPTVT